MADIHRGSWVVARDRVLDAGQVASVQRVIAAWRTRPEPDCTFARLFTFLLHLPLRLSEALALRPGDVHADRQQPFVRARRLKKKEGKRQVDDLPIPPAAVEALCSGSARGTIFGSARGAVSKFAAIRAWHRLCNEAGVPLPKGCAVHILRHTGATELLRRTKNLRLVQEVLGHASPTTTAGYAHVAQSEIGDALNSLWT